MAWLWLRRVLIDCFWFVCFSAIKLSHESSIQGLQIDLVEIDSLPFINTDLEVAGKYPPAVEAFRQKILEADGFLFASPEYNYSISPVLKNAIDWASRPPNVWATISAAIISAGGGFGGGACSVPSAPDWSLSRSPFHQQARVLLECISATSQV
ncbi:hypothetical protein QQ045_004084 [Rhodiola kirilowii]